MRLLLRNCSDGSSKCYSRVEDGYTIRGCAVDLDNATRNACNNEMVCMLCTYKEGCNRDKFPSIRAHCLQCSGNSTSSDCAADTSSSSAICPLYKSGDKCYIRKSNRTVDGSIQRGCLSSAQAQQQCVEDDNCFTCVGYNCNYLTYNDINIPLARDSAFKGFLSVSLMIAGLLAAWKL
ncbi:uncharacterized protein LOC123037964 isoform X2 [Drosophila rhopaloa]|nr:uncharacterized protein LOC123037964 isoform X2 [Drosophila rhopaloa]